MSMTEQGTQITQSAMIEVSKTSTKLSVNLVGTSTHAVASMLDFVATTLHNARSQHNNKPGQTTLSRLQERVDGDVHAQVLDPSLEKILRQELNCRGINFAIEHAPDGQTYVHFAGKDLHTLEHAVTQTEARLGTDQQLEIRTPDQAPALTPTKDSTPTDGTQPPPIPATDTAKDELTHKVGGTQAATPAPQHSPERAPGQPVSTDPKTKKEVVKQIKTRAEQIVKSPTEKNTPIKVRGSR